MKHSDLTVLKGRLEEGYELKLVQIIGKDSSSPTLRILLEANDKRTTQFCAYDQIPDILDFIKMNYPDVPIKG